MGGWGGEVRALLAAAVPPRIIAQLLLLLLLLLLLAAMFRMHTVHVITKMFRVRAVPVVVSLSFFERGRSKLPSKFEQEFF